LHPLLERSSKGNDESGFQTRIGCAGDSSPGFGKAGKIVLKKTEYFFGEKKKSLSLPPRKGKRVLK
jgi:hypothetical protein